MAKDKVSIDEVAETHRNKLLDIAVHTGGKDRAAMGDSPRLHLETISIDAAVGVPGIDDMLGGGWRRGRMGMVVGEASMGKTLLTQWTMAAFQHLGYSVGFIDPEKTYDADWFARTGVDIKKLIVQRPANTEQAFDLACKWSEAGMDLIVIDSLAALVPKARMENDLETQEYMGRSAFKISEGLGKLTGENVNSFILCTNQLRSKIGVVYGSPDEIPGGRAQKFYASYIIKVSRGDWIKDPPKADGVRVGYQLKLETQKNKLAPPFLTAKIPFMFTGLVDTTGGAVELAIELGMLAGKSGYYRWNDKVIHGMSKLKAHFTEFPEELDQLKAKIATGETDISDFGDRD